MPPFLLVFFLSILPISEIRGAIPIGFFYYHLSLWKVFLVALLGNVLTTLILLLFLKRISLFFKRQKNFLKNFWDLLLNHYYLKHKKTIQSLGAVALIIFVAIPLPFTGAWSGSLIAFIFNLSFKKSFFLISIGIILAGILVSLGCLGLIKINETFGLFNF
ncbi:small multi-drug export protein [bacterium]|nr:small multi-drug export protein [bacterium]